MFSSKAIYFRDKAACLWFLFAFLCLYLGIWYSSCFYDGREGCLAYRQIGAFFGGTGYSCFAVSLLLSSRWKRLEDWIGGLDRIYRFHRQFGILGFVLILTHPWVEAVKWLPRHLDRFFLFIFPFHRRIGVNLGSIAFWLMVIILAITLLKLLPYNKWKVLHRFMTLVFILASLHVLLTGRQHGSEASKLILLLPMTVGFLGIIYKQVYISLIKKRPLFDVIDAKRVNDNIVEVFMQPKDALFDFTPGQYGFFSFKNTHFSNEPHPFTLIAPKEGKTSFSILVKARGDYTKNFYKHIQKGVSANFDGPYGRFDYTKWQQPQIWIGGGIGIAPFLSWIRSMEKNPPGNLHVDFYFCAHRKADTVFFEEFKQFENKHPQFRCFLHCTEECSRLNFESILSTSKELKKKSILMCGPIKLTRFFQDRFIKAGVKKEQILFEDFEFF